MLLRVILGAVYVVMAAGQLVSWRQMPDLLRGYGLGTAASRAWAVVLVLGEAVAGTWFLLRPTSPELPPVLVFAGVAIAWTALGVRAYPRRKLIRNCGCFGRFLPQPLSWFTLAQDALLLLYSALLIRGAL